MSTGQRRERTRHTAPDMAILYQVLYLGINKNQFLRPQKSYQYIHGSIPILSNTINIVSPVAPEDQLCLIRSLPVRHFPFCFVTCRCQDTQYIMTGYNIPWRVL